MDNEIMEFQVNNNCEGFGCFKKATSNINVKVGRRFSDLPDSIKNDNDIMISCPDRICAECGNDHSFRGNFEGVIISIDLIPEFLYNKREVSGGI